MSDWQWLWWFDLGSFECRPLVKWDRYFLLPDAVISVGGAFPVLLFEPPYSVSGKVLAAYVSTRDETVSEIPGLKRPLTGLVLLENGDSVTAHLLEPYWANNRYLAHGGVEVARDTLGILGATSDLAHVFFIKEVQEQGGGWALTLWDYSPAEHNLRKLTDWVGSRFKVSSDGQSFGFLETSERRAQGQSVWDAGAAIWGARIFDLNGNLVRRYDFKQPIVASEYDWDPTWEVIAYFDAQHLVVQSLDGRLLGKFSLFRMADLFDFLQSISLKGRGVPH